MTLIKSISGIRGTIGGPTGSNLTPVDLVEFISAYAVLLRKSHEQNTVIVGRDGRISGAPIKNLVISTLNMCGVDVIDLDLTTTPTVEIAVVQHKAQGGIILTASHNPAEWNALKFLNASGEFISSEDGQELLDIIRHKSFHYVEVSQLGSLERYKTAIADHITSILNLTYVNSEKVKAAKFHVVVDAINSTGAISIPPLLDALGVTYSIINEEVSGKFAHNPEPLPANLKDLMQHVKNEKADLGIAVDPDVDRLAFVSEDGSYFGEEYTLVAVADHILTYIKGPTVSNLSSSKALTDISQQYGVEHFQSAVGEVNVVNKMKEEKAVIGGEGNGGVIVPDLHYGRDALAGIAIALSLLAERAVPMSALRASYAHYEMIKDKITIDATIDTENIIDAIRDKYVSSYRVSTVDGVKVFYEDGWVHLRKSNTEPIIRIYSEAPTVTKALEYVENIKLAISEMM